MSIEQFLGGNGETIEWLSIKKDDDKYLLNHFNMNDDGDENYCDLYSFSPVEEENYAGNEYEYYSLEEVLKNAESKFKADLNKFVNEGVVQDIYLKYKKTHNHRVNWTRRSSGALTRK